MAVAVVVLLGATAVALDVLGVPGPLDAIAPQRDDVAATARPASTRYVAEVTRSETERGTVYRVRPTRDGRLASRDELDDAWRQAVAAGVPDERGLRQQFLCHPLSGVARLKPTWNVETWWPTVGLTRTMLAACNPV